MPRTRLISRHASGWTWAPGALAALLAAVVAAACGGDDPCDSLTGPAVVTSVEVTGPDGAIPIGATAQFRAVAKSACGAAVEGATVSWSSTDPQVATVSSNGVVTGVGEGQASIQASSEGQMGTTPVLVEPAAVAQVEVVPDAAAAAVGDTVRFAAILRDAQGNVLTGRGIAWSSGEEDVASVSPAGLAQGLAPGTAPIVATAEGVSGSGTLTVSAAPPPRLVFLDQPTDTRVGEPIAPPVRARLTTPDGTPITDDTGGPVTVSLADNPGGATLRGTLSVGTVNGVATFANLTLDRAADGYRLRVARADAVPATSQAFDVAEGDPATLEFTVGPTSVVAGVAMSPAVEVTIRDQFGTPVSGWSEPVTLTLASGPAGATLGGTTQVTPVNGVARFTNLRLERAGTNYTLRASTGGLTAVSGSFVVTAASGASLHFTAQPEDAVAGSTMAPVAVQVRDAFGNVAGSWNEDVALELTGAPEGVDLEGNTARAPSAGTATFDNLSIEVAGTGYRLRATSAGLPAAQSEAFTISGGSVASIAFGVQPTNTVAGASIAPPVVVQLRDSFGNPAGGTPTVVVQLIQSNGAVLLGTTEVAASNGSAAFADLRIERAGAGYELRATTAGQQATSAKFAVVAGPKAALGFSVQPPDRIRDDRLFDVEVSVYDAFGNLVPSNLDVVSLQFGQKPNPNAFLGGTLVRTTNQGRAAFNNIFVTRDGNGYTLVASSPGLVRAESEPFEVF